MTLTAQGEVKLHPTAYPLEAINDAMADLDGGRLQERGILIPEAAVSGGDYSQDMEVAQAGLSAAGLTKS